MMTLAFFSYSAELAHGVSSLIQSRHGNSVPCIHMGVPNALSPDLVLEMFRDFDNGADVLVFVDMGATENVVELAIEKHSTQSSQKIKICSAPFVEGALIAASMIVEGVTFDEVCAQAEEYPYTIRRSLPQPSGIACPRQYAIFR